MGIDASDFRKFTVDLSKARGKVGNGAQVVVRKSLVDGVAAAKNKVAVDTGNLKGSISHSDLRTVGSTGTIGGEFGPTANYGEYVERGTSRMAPQPYMGPAADLIAPGFEQAMAQLGEEALGG